MIFAILLSIGVLYLCTVWFILPSIGKHKYKIIKTYSAAFDCFFYQVLIDGIHYSSERTLEDAELIIERHKNIQVKL